MSSQLTLVEKERLLKLAKSFRVESITATLPSISVVEHREHLPLSFAQQRLWFLAQMGAQPRPTTFPTDGDCRDSLIGGALRRALDRIVARHEALRTTLRCYRRRTGAAHRSCGGERFQLLEHDLAGRRMLRRARSAGEGGSDNRVRSGSGAADSRAPDPAWRRGACAADHDASHRFRRLVDGCVDEGIERRSTGLCARGSGPAAGLGAVCRLCGVAAAVDGRRDCCASRASTGSGRWRARRRCWSCRRIIRDRRSRSMRAIGWG